MEFSPFGHGMFSLLYLQMPPMNVPHTVGFLVLSKGWLLRVLSSVLKLRNIARISVDDKMKIVCHAVRLAVRVRAQALATVIG